MKNFFLALALILICVPAAVFAQEPSVPFDQQFKPAEDKKDAPPANAEEFTKTHFLKCLARDHMALTKNEVESICSCSAANLSQTLSFEEMQAMSQRTTAGKNARGKFVGFAYAPCVRYLVADMTKNDCLSSELAKNIKVGKMATCKCAEKKMLSVIDNLSAHFMIEEVNKDSMNLDPIDYFLSSEAYFSQRDGYIKDCIYETAYERDNR